MISINEFIILAICYCLLFLICLAVWRMKSENLESEKVMNGNWLLLHLRHAGGMIVIGVLPAILLLNTPDEILIWPDPFNLIQALTFSIAALLLVAIVLASRDSLPTVKNIDHKYFITNVWVHLLLRSSFLACYEWFFRGCILFSCIDQFGIPVAIIINLVLYSLIHSFNGKKELYGSLPFGLLLCVFTIWYQSVWPAILLHLILSSSHEFFLLSSFFNKKSNPVL